VLRPECLAPGDSRRARAVSRVRQRGAGVPGALGGLGTASCREGLQSGLQSRRRNGWKLLSWNAIGWFELAARRRGRLPPAPRLAPGDLRIAGRFLTPGTRLVEPASAAARRRASRLGFASQEGGLRSQPARAAPSLRLPSVGVGSLRLRDPGIGGVAGKSASGGFMIRSVKQPYPATSARACWCSTTVSGPSLSMAIENVSEMAIESVPSGLV
jgi:hypothetical protein